MAGVATDGRAAVAGGAAVARFLSNSSMSPEQRLVELVDTPEKALELVEGELNREKLFTHLQEQRDLFAKLPTPNSENPNPETIASNVFDPEKFKGIDLRGVDASAIRFLNNKGDQVSIADFILGLNPEDAKSFFQGTVYDEGTKFSTDEEKGSEGRTKNERVHKLLESISSEYKGGSNLTNIQALVEPAETRFRRLLVPSEAGSRSNEVEGSNNTARVVGTPVAGGSPQPAVQSSESPEVGQTVTEQANSDTSVTNHSTAVAQHDEELAEELRTFIKLSAQERVDKIKKLVEPEEDSVDVCRRIVANQKAIELVKGWLTSQLDGDGFGVIVRAVESRDAENEASEQAEEAQESSNSRGEQQQTPRPANAADTETSLPNNIEKLVEAYNYMLINAGRNESMPKELAGIKEAFGVDITQHWVNQLAIGRSGDATLEVATNGSYRVFKLGSDENSSHMLLPTKQTMSVISKTGKGNGIFEVRRVANLGEPQLIKPAVIEPNSNDNEQWKVTTTGIIQIAE